MEGLKALSPVQQRKAAAILGALLADAASECIPTVLSMGVTMLKLG